MISCCRLLSYQIGRIGKVLEKGISYGVKGGEDSLDV
jgi:hypothetical protein